MAAHHDRRDQMNLVLTGFMGTGKSTIGRLVAEELGWPFVDADEVIAARAGMSISRIFTHYGESGFRQLETAVARSLSRCGDQVIATGGGMLIDAENRRLLSQCSVIVCLHARPDVIARRLAANDDRPLAGDWRALLARRHAVYQAMPHHVDTSDKSPQTSAQEVLAIWHASV
ncbi:MAG: shikimate kinase [Chloroflexota bacterium]